MTTIPEPLGRPRSSSSRSLSGTLEAMGTPEMDRDKEETRILKVCFYSNSFNLGKNFKLVKCSVATEIRVRGKGGIGMGLGIRGWFGLLGLDPAPSRHVSHVEPCGCGAPEDGEVGNVGLDKF